MNMMVARLSPGAISESSSSHLPPSVASLRAKPVTFPPGRSSRSTRPLATGSPPLAKTIGIVRVSRWRAMVVGVELAKGSCQINRSDLQADGGGWCSSIVCCRKLWREE